MSELVNEARSAWLYLIVGSSCVSAWQWPRQQQACLALGCCVRQLVRGGQENVFEKIFDDTGEMQAARATCSALLNILQDAARLERSVSLAMRPFACSGRLMLDLSCRRGECARRGHGISHITILRFFASCGYVSQLSRL